MKKIMTLLLLLVNSILYAQNVGIGESSPTVMKLQVKALDSAVLLLHNSTSSGSSVKTGLFFKTGTSYGGSIASIGSGNSFRLGLFTYGGPNPSGLLERVSISDGGNVGVNTTDPQSKFHVRSLDSNAMILENTSTLGSNVKTALFFKTGLASSFFTGAIKSIGETDNASRMGFYTYSSPDKNDLAERLTIGDNGNIGINNVAPAQKLSVNGNMYVATSAVIGTNLQVAGQITGSTILSGGSITGQAISGQSIATTGAANIGTSLTAANATVSGSISVGSQASVQTLRVSGGSPAANKVLASYLPCVRH